MESAGISSRGVKGWKGKAISGRRRNAALPPQIGSLRHLRSLMFNLFREQQSSSERAFTEGNKGNEAEGFFRYLRLLLLFGVVARPVSPIKAGVLTIDTNSGSSLFIQQVGDMIRAHLNIRH